MKLLPNFKKYQGFSLIEILLVIAVVGMIILVLSNLPSSFGLIGSGNYETVAKQIAQKKIDDLRTQTYDNLANGTTSLVDTRLNKLPGGSGQSIIQDCPVIVCTGAELTKQVTVSLNWKESGKNKSININTFISQGGLH